jgi:hypothetical protein
MTLYEADKQNVQIQVIELKEKLSKLSKDLGEFLFFSL